MSEYIYRSNGEPLANDRGEISLALAGEIVRCRDCRRYNNQEPGGEIGTCNLGLEDLDLLSIVEPDGFCAWGERQND